MLSAVPQVGQQIKDALLAEPAKPVVVELDWKESVLHEDDRCAGSRHCCVPSPPHLQRAPAGR